jgi:glycosyltransferase involved in cell wall biosynthesis
MISLRPIALEPLPNLPLVSILVPNYNYASYLTDAIQSCLSQTYRNFEVIICDDGSTDTSREILNQYHSLDPRIKPIYQENGGQSLALNAAFRHSTGEIICLLDADDVFLPDKVKRVVDALAAAPCSGFAVNRMRLVDKARRYLGSIPSLYDLPSGWQGASLCPSAPQILLGLPPTSGLSLRRSVAEAIFPLPAGLKAYSDSLIQVLAPMATPIVALEIVLSEYRVHGDNLAGVSRFTETRLRNIASYEREIWMAWRRYLASPCSGLPPNFPLPSIMAPSLMDYAYARFRSDKNSRAIYYAIPHTRLHTLPRPHQLYWRASVIFPTWLFRRSFDFVYGQPRLKMIARRILAACRKSAWLSKWTRRRKPTRAEPTRRLPSAASAKSPSGF